MKLRASIQRKENAYRDSAAATAGGIEAAEPRDGLWNLHPELRLRWGPLRGSRPVATSTYPPLSKYFAHRGEEEKAVSAPRKHHSEQGAGASAYEYVHLGAEHPDGRSEPP